MVRACDSTELMLLAFIGVKTMRLCAIAKGSLVAVSKRLREDLRNEEEIFRNERFVLAHLGDYNLARCFYPSTFWSLS
jgi:hypothetical protein